MFVIECPWCGKRDQREFVNGGEAHISRPLASEHMNDEQWADYLFMRTNPQGLHAERWVHAHGCGQWFNVLRDTTTDTILESYRMGEKPACKDVNQVDVEQEDVSREDAA
ncbi:MAG: sarcosine oxidase subunit delta [Wenzhouxiangellaceae bacterium]